MRGRLVVSVMHPASALGDSARNPRMNKLPTFGLYYPRGPKSRATQGPIPALYYRGLRLTRLDGGVGGLEAEEDLCVPHLEHLVVRRTVLACAEAYNNT